MAWSRCRQPIRGRSGHQPGIWPAGRARKAVAAFLACAACGCVAACSASAAPAGGPAYELRASAVRGLGRVLADGHGFTLYIYEPDRQGASVCTGLCAKQWPPLLLPRGVRRPIAGSGVKAALLGTTRRADGSLQITYNGWPLYLWQDDQEPGQATGQADDMGLWYVLSATGTVDRAPLPGE